MQLPTQRQSHSHLPLYYPFLPPHTPQTHSHSLLFMELFHHVFLHAYYRRLPYASGMAPMKHLNNLSPPVCLATLQKVFPNKLSKLFMFSASSGREGQTGPKLSRTKLACTGLCDMFHPSFLSFHQSFFLLPAPFSVYFLRSAKKNCIFISQFCHT